MIWVTFRMRLAIVSVEIWIGKISFNVILQMGERFPVTRDVAVELRSFEVIVVRAMKLRANDACLVVQH